MFKTRTRHMRIAKKMAAALFSLVFFVSFVLSDASAVVEVAPLPFDLGAEAPRTFAPLQMDTFTIPAHLGEIKLKSQGASDKFVIHIQDAHCNKYAQVKVADMIDYLTEEYGINVINLEGGVGPYDLSAFTSISGDAIRREVALHFLKKGEINGAEFFAVNNPDKVTLWGIEDKDLYLANLRVYRDSLLYKEEVDGYISELDHVIGNLKRHMFSQDLLDIHSAYAEYKTGRQEFKAYLSYIMAKSKAAGIILKDYNNLFMLKRTMDMEDDIDFKRANRERDVLIDELKKRLSKQEVRELVSKTLQFKTKRIPRKNFYEYLLGKATLLDLDSRDYPELSNYIIYVTTYEDVDRFQVMRELNELEQALKERFFSGEEQRELDVLSKNLTLTKNIFAISLTKNDYKYFLGNRDLFETGKYQGFIDKYAPRYRISARLSPNILDLDEYLDDISGFFDYSFKRDEAFIRNMKYTKAADGKEIAIVLMGGFHTENFCDLMDERGMSYVSILPNFTSGKDYKNPYFDILAGQTTDVQKMIATVIAKASMIQVASMLNNVLGEAVWGELGMDSFRAAIALRTLAARGIKVDIVDARRIVIARPRFDDAGEKYRKAEAIPVTTEVLINMLRNEELIDPQIQDAWGDTISGSNRRAYNFENVDELLASGDKDAREIAVEFLDSQAAAMDKAGETQAAQKLRLISKGVMEAPIYLYTGVDGFLGHAGGMGIHINMDAVLDAEGVKNEDGDVVADKAAQVMAALLIHEAFAGFGYDHAFSQDMEWRVLGILPENIPGTDAAVIEGSGNVRPVWETKQESERWTYNRDVASDQIEDAMAAVRVNMGLNPLPDRWDKYYAARKAIDTSINPWESDLALVQREIQKIEQAIPEDSEGSGLVQGKMLNFIDLSGKKKVATKRHIFQKGEEDLPETGEIVLEEKVNQGGMGEVWRGTKTDIVLRPDGQAPDVGRKVAVKFLFDNANPRILLSFFQEFKRGDQGMHGVVKSLDIGKVKVFDSSGQPEMILGPNGEMVQLEKYYMVQEWAGEDLLENLGRLSTNNLVLGGLTGLAELHERNEVHNDVKTENFLVRDGVVTVADLGFVTELPEGEESMQVSGFFGTTTFAPNESFGEKRINKRKDLYGMAQTIFIEKFGALLGGVQPFNTGDDDANAWYKARRKKWLRAKRASYGSERERYEAVRWAKMNVAEDLDGTAGEFAEWADRRARQAEGLARFADDPFMEFLYNLFTSADRSPDGLRYSNLNGYPDAKEALKAYLRLENKRLEWYIMADEPYENINIDTSGYADLSNAYADITDRVNNGFQNGKFRLRPGDVLFDQDGGVWKITDYARVKAEADGSLTWSLKIDYYAPGYNQPTEKITRTLDEIERMFTYGQVEKAGREYAHYTSSNFSEGLRQRVKSQISALKEGGSLRRNLLANVQRQQELIRQASRLESADLYDVTPSENDIDKMLISGEDPVFMPGYMLLDDAELLYEVLRVEGGMVWLRVEDSGTGQVLQDPDIYADAPNYTIQDMRKDLIDKRYTKIMAPLRTEREMARLLTNTIASRNLRQDKAKVEKKISENEIKDRKKIKRLVKNYRDSFDTALEMFSVYRPEIESKLRAYVSQKFYTEAEIEAEVSRQMELVSGALSDPESNFERWFNAYVGVNERDEVEYVLGERNALASNLMSFLRGKDPLGEQNLVAEYILHEALEKTELDHPDIIGLTTKVVFVRGADEKGNDRNPLGDALKDFISSASESSRATKTSRDLLGMILRGDQPNIQLVEVSEEAMIELQRGLEKERQDIKRAFSKKFGINMQVIYFTRESVNDAIAQAKQLVEEDDTGEARVMACCSEAYRPDLDKLMQSEEIFRRIPGEYGNTYIGAVTGNFVSTDANERYSDVYMAVFAAGLMERDRAYVSKDAEKISTIEGYLQELAVGLVNNKDDFEESDEQTLEDIFNDLLDVNGDIIMNIKKIDFEEIKDIWRANSQVLQSL